MAAPATFHSFSRLPAELRLKVWEYAVPSPPPAITISLDVEARQIECNAFEPLLCATRASRFAARRLLQGRQRIVLGLPASENDPPPGSISDQTQVAVYFDPKRTILQICPTFPIVWPEEPTPFSAEKSVWKVLFHTLGQSLKVVEHIHFVIEDSQLPHGPRVRQYNTPWLWENIEYCEEWNGLDNLKAVTVSHLTVQQLNDGKYRRCFHGVPCYDLSKPTQCLLDCHFNAIKTEMRSVSFPTGNEYRRCVRLMRLRGRIRLPIPDAILDNLDAHESGRMVMEESDEDDDDD
ncbi:hypothetical protein BCR34DRAFT_584691 [Clohesyomyces aquaticus]|uniref:2EXR domain-containing protein n=1 Tax=Clohesyomyces aquaticus TaxID=1231657 RepID=A0A1Y2A106_9PLEO|nr:hypothetical protein BCR34DRAFT_584691 [Clohesyomyces aquaticus]